MDPAQLYVGHLERLQERLAGALELAGRGGLAVDGVLFHSGRSRTYHRDDEEVPFRTAPHFRRWVPPLEGPEHVVLARPGRRLRVVQVRPEDYWFDTSPAPPSHWEGAVELAAVGSFEEVAGALGELGRAAYVGESPEAAAALGISEDRVEPEVLMAPLDWGRATKTGYEVALIRVACQRAAAGHLRAREVFRSGGSEREVYRAYLEAADELESEQPFGAIVAHDEKAAILHYQHKRRVGESRGRVLLLDAGAAHCGYAADVTRTWARDDAHPTFRQLLAGVDAMQRRLVAMVTPGRSYVDLHLECHRQVAAILAEAGVLRCSPEEALDLRLTRAFLPHGVGHLLGLQVHDVGGHQEAPEGGLREPPDDHVLRNTRTIEPGHLVTVEPGLYFIPMLLDPWRQGGDAAKVDWRLVDELLPHGGIRIEDDVLATEEGWEDLTRPLVEGP